MAKKTFKSRIDQNISWLSSDKEKMENEIKSGVAPLIKALDSSSLKENEDEILEYMNLLEEFDKIIFEKFNERYEEVNKPKLEKPQLKKDSISTPSKSPSINHNQNKPNPQQIKTPAAKASSNDLNKLEQNINNSLKQLSTQIQALGNTSVLKKELDKFQADLSFKIEKQFRDRKDIYEELETLPVTLKDLAVKVDSIKRPSAAGSSSSLEIPKDEQSVVDLTRLMKDGLDQFEHIAKFYLQNQSKFDKSDKVSKDTQNALIKSEEIGIEKGKKLERISVATEIFNKFPEKFNDIKSVFEDFITEEYLVDEEIDITLDNRQEYEIKINGIKTESKIIIESPAVLIGGEIVKKATIKESN